jgi:hypothetical protein
MVMGRKDEKQLTLFGTTLAEEEEAKKRVEALAEVLMLPIITFPGYEDIVTPEQRLRITAERMKKIKEGDLSKEATDFEAMLYISTVSLAQPLSEEWFNIYAYLFSKYYPEQAKEIGVPKTLNSYELTELKKLKEWIYRKQIEHLKKKA